MFLPRRNHSLYQRAIRAFENARHPRTLARLGLISASALAVAACEPPDNAGPSSGGDSPLVESEFLELVSTGVMETIPSEGADSVTFVPDRSTAWAGLIATAASEGGIDLFNVDGESVFRMTGPRLWGLAAAPDFQLRGEPLPLLFGADRNTNLVRAYALLRNEPELIEAPIAPIGPEGEIASVCALGQGIGYFDLMVLSRGTTVEIWRISDDGGDVIGADRRARFDLPSPVRTCAAGNESIYASGPAGAVYRLAEDGSILEQVAGTAVSLAAGEFLGRPVLIVSDGSSATLEIRDGRSLDLIGNAIIRNGFSIPGVDRPGAIAVSEASFGGASYQSGLVAITDEDDGRVRLIARETFARGITVVD